MINTNKQLICLVLSLIFVLSSVTVFSSGYDVYGIYNECYSLYPDFIDKVKNEGVTDQMIINFISSVNDYLVKGNILLTEDNFHDYMFEAVKHAFGLVKNIRVRNALSSAYPSSVSALTSGGVIPDEFMPIYETVRRYVFGIKTPVVTLSSKKVEETVFFYAHSVNLPSSAYLIVGLYSADGTLLHAKKIIPDIPSEYISCDCENLAYAKLFAWDSSLSPVCNYYETGCPA